MNRGLSVLLDWLFPPKCAFCGKLLERAADGLCAACQKTLPWLEGGNAEGKVEFVGLTASPLAYRGHVRDSIHRYKFSGRRGYAQVYGKLVAQCVGDHLAGRYDLISWVPLSDKSLRKRGYDQAMLLAMATALALGDVAVETLRKHRATPAQSSLEGAAARRANVMGAYECADRELVEEKRVLLVDDVITTGSTVSECARVLLTAGAREVVCATLAKAGA